MQTYTITEEECETDGRCPSEKETYPDNCDKYEDCEAHWVEWKKEHETKKHVFDYCDSTGEKTATFRGQYDPKKENKTKYHLLDFDFLEEVAKVFQDGIKGDRKEGDWAKLPPSRETESLYFDACLRHLKAAVDSKGTPRARWHFAAVAANAMILWYHSKWRNNGK